MYPEKSLIINNMPGDGIPNFTIKDVRYALSHMKTPEFNYCQYVFMLYGIEPLFALTENTFLYIVKKHPEIIHKSDMKILIKLCRMACIEQTKPAGKISSKQRYTQLGLTRNKWHYQWKNIFVCAVNYLNNLRQEVIRHFYLMTRGNEQT